MIGHLNSRSYNGGKFIIFYANPALIYQIDQMDSFILMGYNYLSRGKPGDSKGFLAFHKP